VASLPQFEDALLSSTEQLQAIRDDYVREARAGAAAAPSPFCWERLC
jgi:hypothetical protein